MCRDKMDTLEYKVKLLESEVESFKAHLNALSPEELQIPSACVGWSVADVIGHLAGQEHASRVRRGLEGDYSPQRGPLQSRITMRTNSQRTYFIEP